MNTSATPNRTNVEAVEHLYESFAAGDVEAIRTVVDPDIELHEPKGLVGGGTLHGFDEIVADVFDSLGDDWTDVSVVPDRFVADDETVVALFTWRGTYVETGKSVEYPGVHVFEFEDGRIARWTSFADTALFNAALED